MAPQQGSEMTPALAPGTLVGGRFVIEQGQRRDATDPLGEVVFARDQKTNKPIAVRVLSSAFAGDPRSFEAIRNEIRAAAKLKHRSLIGTYGIGTHEKLHFVACEWVQGLPLSEFLARRPPGSRPLSVRGIYNVIAHVCKALSAVHASSCHGALRPSVIWVTKSGRVKVGELGSSLALVNGGKWSMLDADEQAFLAPEVRAGSPATARSDLFSVGAILYALLTQRGPGEALVKPSQEHPDASPGLDAVVEQCMSADPSARYESAADVSHALLGLVAGTPEPERDEFGVDLEIDVDIALSLAPRPLAAAPAQAAAPRGPLEAPRPRVASSPGNGAGARDPLAVRAPSTPGNELAPARRSPAHDLSALTAKLTENDAPRWMAVKDGLDHGPFTARELIKLIVEGQILEQHGLLNMTTSDRKPLGEWEEFREFVEQYRLRKAEADHQTALAKSTRIERGSNVAKFAILGGTLAVLVVAVGGYLMSRQAAKKRAAAGDEDLAAMFESGRVKISGTAGILKAGARRAGRRGGGGPGGDNTGFSSYDDAMNQAMELGDVSRGGGEAQLRTSDIQAVMDRKLNSLFGCVGQELRSGRSLGNVQIDLAILGSGNVAGASVSAGSGEFRRCIVGKLRQVRFPSFPAPRMGARYSFSVN